MICEEVKSLFCPEVLIVRLLLHSFPHSKHKCLPDIRSSGFGEAPYNTEPFSILPWGPIPCCCSFFPHPKNISIFLLNNWEHALAAFGFNDGCPMKYNGAMLLLFISRQLFYLRWILYNPRMTHSVNHPNLHSTSGRFPIRRRAVRSSLPISKSAFGNINCIGHSII